MHINVTHGPQLHSESQLRINQAMHMLSLASTTLDRLEVLFCLMRHCGPSFFLITVLLLLLLLLGLLVSYYRKLLMVLQQTDMKVYYSDTFASFNFFRLFLFLSTGSV